MAKIDLSSLIGKTIAYVKIRESWKTKSIDELAITLTDGSKIEISATTESGCSECDYDSRNETTVNVDLCLVK